MKFIIDTNISMRKGKLSYVIDEYAFDMTPSIKGVGLEISINKLTLTVDENDIVVQVWGMCPYSKWLFTDKETPSFKQGALRLLTDLEPGFSYRLNKDKEWDVYVNPQTGWLCIGNLEAKGDAVEFNNGCVAVLDKNTIVSIWLKPIELPSLL